MKQQYRITSWRFDVRSTTHSTPEFEGESVEDCDRQALAHFGEVSAKPDNAWECMDIARIDSPAVAEKVTYLAKNDNARRDELRD